MRPMTATGLPSGLSWEQFLELLEQDEYKNAELIDGPLAHLPSGVFTANAAWLSCAGIAHNLLHAAATLASRYHATARSGTLRRHLIGVPARISHRGRDQIILHLPEHWPWAQPWLMLWDRVLGDGLPPPVAA